jgi:hypothetical protein
MAALPVGKPVDPWSAGIMGATSVATAALDDKTNQTLNNSYTAAFDNSGWNVNVGAGASQSTQTDRSTSALGLSSLLQNPVVLIALAAVAFLYLKRR